MSEHGGAQGPTRPAVALAPAHLADERAPGAMLTDPAQLAGRGVRALLRQPWFVGDHAGAAGGLAAAVRRAVPEAWCRLPNGDYIAYLTPGIVVMSALFSSGWAGMGFITDARARGDGPVAGLAGPA